MLAISPDKKCGTTEALMERERRERMILSPGYGPSYIYTPHFLIHYDTTGPNITSFAYAESVSEYAESLWEKRDEKLPWAIFNPDAAGPDDRYDIFIRNFSSYNKIFSRESLVFGAYLGYIECDNNIFKSQTVIRFPLTTIKKLSILIYNQSGEVVKNFDYGKQKPGDYTLRWDGRDNKGKMVDPSVYFYTLKISGLETAKSIIFFLGDKMVAMEGKSLHKTAVNDPPIKIEECGFEKTQETLFAPFESLDIKKKLLTGKTPTDAFKEAESLYKFAEDLLKKNPIKNGFYQNTEYVKEASGMAYLAALRTIDAYLLSKGVLPEKLPVTTLNSEYREAIVKIPHKGNLLTISLETVYDKLLWFGYFWGGKEDKVIKEGLSKVKFIITTMKEQAKKEKGWR